MTCNQDLNAQNDPDTLWFFGTPYQPSFHFQRNANELDGSAVGLGGEEELGVNGEEGVEGKGGVGKGNLVVEGKDAMSEFGIGF